ncbi:alpha-ketoglutarate-dependent dioxygenase AlkB [Polynucleobacter sp. MWH-Berg-3C6]|uniref:alpha-ketoglutarate-dependent dioxygenase AlkB family protein n=1 Tax=Polynucleobacter sp. MWH-Berg-3C6 TaxID=1855882 RepID=UPI001C0E4FA8|nr:alpha-ketoglutarate-dependent dioxygenase AlkB [Polynucleobacter sp. MWH-Berg-3C6]MBU3550826.1 alpha-ketoglutarate-dependent dioxygenase AlkB [Polynucleobacter sp. MWH-Berg-3C6]
MKQTSLFETIPSQYRQNYLPKDGSAYYHAEWMSGPDSANLMNQLKNSLQWEADQLFMFGKQVVTRRQVAWVGDANCTYTYSGVKKHAQPWIPELLAVKAQMEKLAQAEFNSCLLNLYHDGKDGMGWHSDNEKELDANSPIASLSLGATRKFAFRHKTDKTTISLPLENGSALVMNAPTQQFWQHALLKTTAIHTARINLTFRKINHHYDN